jgi:hypothetical protein
MNNVEFKKIVQDITSEYGFKYFKKNYYYEMSDLIIVIGLQKSNYENSYYINFGFYVKEIHNDIQYPKSNECDITGRFLNETGKGIYQLDIQYREELVNSLQKNINDFIVPVINAGIKHFFILFPQYSCLASINLKKYLGMN